MAVLDSRKPLDQKPAVCGDAMEVALAEAYVSLGFTEEKQKQELNSFRNIPDSFKKIVIVNGTKKPWRNEEGFVIMGMKYFLLNADSLEL